ncbi:hypothetical protein [Acinetobacter sp. WZC-1]|uniref:hypothetical protein n=1 Tax=Acinetobacter sp. WZC-1 TaxID=3459034 RepID=UPI00403E2163
MHFLILLLICVAVGFIVVRRFDRRRWHRCQIERDIFFRNHPYGLNGDQQFKVSLALSQSAQKKLVNELMLKPIDQSVYKKACLQREAGQHNQPFLVRVMIHDFKIGYLEPAYAEQLCKNLHQTDFMIGRPVAVLAEILIFQKTAHDFRCRVKLDLPQDPRRVRSLIDYKTVEGSAD